MPSEGWAAGGHPMVSACSPATGRRPSLGRGVVGGYHVVLDDRPMPMSALAHELMAHARYEVARPSSRSPGGGSREARDAGARLAAVHADLGEEEEACRPGAPREG